MSDITYVSNSSLGSLICESKCFLEYVQGYSADRQSAILAAGSAAHLAWAEYFKGAKAETALQVFRDAYEPFTDDLENYIEERLDFENTYLSLQQWFNRNPRSKLPWRADPDHVEMTIELPLDEHGDFRFIAILDLLATDRVDGSYVVVDNKCLPGSAQVDTDAGVKTIAELFQEQRRWTCVAYTGTKLVKTEALPPRENARQKIIEIRSRFGRSARYGDNHPLLTKRGWVAARDIQPGDQLALAVQKLDPQETSASNPLLWFIGAWLAEGCYSASAMTQVNQEFLDYAKQCLHSSGFGNAAVDFKYGDRPAGIRFRKSSGIFRQLRQLGFEEVKSPERRLPKSMFRLSFSETCALLGGLWSGDGHVSIVNSKRTYRNVTHVDKIVRIIYSTASEQLAKDVAELLRLIGILASTTSYYITYKGERRKYFSTKVIGIQSKKQFMDLVERDLIPILKQPEIDIAAVQAELGNRSKLPQRKYDPTDGIVWDSVVAVEDVGEEMTYDVEVPEHHTFVADGYVTHNTSRAITEWFEHKFINGSQMTGYCAAAQYYLGDPSVNRVYINALVFKKLNRSFTKCTMAAHRGMNRADCWPDHVEMRILGPYERTEKQIQDWRRTTLKLAKKFKELHEIYGGEPTQKMVDTLKIEGAFSDNCRFCIGERWCSQGRPVHALDRMFVKRARDGMRSGVVFDDDSQ